MTGDKNKPCFWEYVKIPLQKQLFSKKSSVKVFPDAFDPTYQTLIVRQMNAKLVSAIFHY